jgi:hypothetical protein
VVAKCNADMHEKRGWIALYKPPDSSAALARNPVRKAGTPIAGNVSGII